MAATLTQAHTCAGPQGLELHRPHGLHPPSMGPLFTPSCSISRLPYPASSLQPAPPQKVPHRAGLQICVLTRQLRITCSTALNLGFFICKNRGTSRLPSGSRGRNEPSRRLWQQILWTKAPPASPLPFHGSSFSSSVARHNLSRRVWLLLLVHCLASPPVSCVPTACMACVPGEHELNTL